VSLALDLINYLGSCGGDQLLSTRAQAALLDRRIDTLRRKLAAETDSSLALSMHFPTAWDPYFKPTMSVLDVYHFATQHYDHHRRQPLKRQTHDRIYPLRANASTSASRTRTRARRQLRRPPRPQARRDPPPARFKPNRPAPSSLAARVLPDSGPSP
jgi:hypothetical protein